MTKRKIRYDPTDDLYAVLGVVPSANTEEIHRAFRKRAKQVHPDLNPEKPEWAHAQFQRVNDAHDILTDDVLRMEYDTKRRLLRGGGQINSSQGAPGMARSTTKLSEASRAAWAHRRRRRGLGGVFLVAFVLFAVSCWMLEFPESENTSNPTSVAGDNTTPVVVNAANLTTPAANIALVPCDTDATITEPLYGTTISGPISIRGTASGPRFASYSLLLGFRNTLEDRMTWLPLAVGINRRVEHSLLVPDGLANLAVLAALAQVRSDFTLRLVVYLQDGKSLAPCEVLFRVGRIVRPTTS